MAYTTFSLTHQLRLQADILGSNQKNTYYKSENLREETPPWQSVSLCLWFDCMLHARDRIMYFLSGVEVEGGN